MILAPVPPGHALPDGTPIVAYDADEIAWGYTNGSIPPDGTHLRLDEPLGEAAALRLILQSRGVAEPGPAVLVCEGEPRRWHIRRFAHVEGRGTTVVACYRLAWDEACRGLGPDDRLEALRRILGTMEAL